MEKHYCLFDVENVVIRWYAKDHPTRPGEIDMLPWCEDFEDTHRFQQGGPGGFWAFRDSPRQDSETWLLWVYRCLTDEAGLSPDTVSKALCDIHPWMGLCIEYDATHGYARPWEPEGNKEGDTK